MPRGVYDRKPKDGKAAPAPAKKAPVAKAVQTKSTKGALKASSLKTLNKSILPDLEKQAGPASENKFSRYVDVGYGFQLLGQTVSTLSDAYEKVKDDPNLSGLVGSEISKTLRLVAALREQTFGELIAPQVVSAPEAIEAAGEVAEEPAFEAPPAATPMAAHPALLPQPTNASFTPPAPPLPHH